MRRPVLVISMLLLAISCVPAAAQAQAPLVGAWERFLHLIDDGQSTQPPIPAAFLVFTASGHWSQVAVPAGRPKVDKSIDQLNREELIARFSMVEARRGTYRVDGTRLVRTNTVSANPSEERTDQIQNFRIEGDVLILTSTDPKSKREVRFRRVR